MIKNFKLASPTIKHTIVIGAGQSGLAVSYYLKDKSIDYLVLDESSEIGHSWSNRYDSLKLFTNIRHNSLVGLNFPGDKNHYPTKDETAAYLKQYAKHFQIPVKHDTSVKSLRKSDELFVIETNNGTYHSKNIIVCTGAFHTPFIPEIGTKTSKEIFQIHSKKYKNSSQLKKGKTLVVGGGNSGVQIVEELVNEGKEVYFSYRGQLKGIGNNPLGVWLTFATGLVFASKHSFVGKHIMKNGEVIIGTDLKKLFSHSNLIQTGAMLGAKENELKFERMNVNDVSNIIWATGYTADFNWIQLPIFDEQGNLETDYGVTRIKGLFFVGSAWQRSRASWLIGGVSRDAKYIAEKIIL